MCRFLALKGNNWLAEDRRNAEYFRVFFHSAAALRQIAPRVRARAGSERTQLMHAKQIAGLLRRLQGLAVLDVHDHRRERQRGEKHHQRHGGIGAEHEAEAAGLVQQRDHADGDT